MATVIDIARYDRFLTRLLRALDSTELGKQLNEPGSFTLFAPVNLAFELIDNRSFDELMKPANRQRLVDILSYHIIADKKMFKDLRNGQKLQALNGKDITISIRDNMVHINGAKILSRDKQASNGVVHCVSAVNLP